LEFPQKNPIIPADFLGSLRAGKFYIPGADPGFLKAGS